MFKSGQHQQAQPSLPHIPTQSWYPPSVLNPLGSSQTSSNKSSGAQPGPSTSSKASLAVKLNSDSQPSPSAVYPKLPSTSSTAAALRDKSVEELKKLMTNKEAYNTFLQSEEFRNLESLLDDLRRNNIVLAKQNLEKESQLAELLNQCMIIKTSELATAQEKFEEVQNREREVYGRFTVSSLLHRLQDSADEVDDESEKLHHQLLAGEIELTEFIQKYRKLRILYHKRILTRLAFMSSNSAG